MWGRIGYNCARLLFANTATIAHRCRRTRAGIPVAPARALFDSSCVTRISSVLRQDAYVHPDGKCDMGYVTSRYSSGGVSFRTAAKRPLFEQFLALPVIGVRSHASLATAMIQSDIYIA